MDYREAALPKEDRALCDYALKLTRHPQDAREADIEALQGFGFTHQAITIAVQVIGYFNYINRIADSLGVDPEEWMRPSKEEWLATKAAF